MPTHPAIQLIQNAPDRFAAQGSVIATWRTYRGRRLGPYYRFTWRENHRQRSIYLGRDEPLVDQVRNLLHEAQEIRRLKREHRRNQEIFRRTVIEPLENYVKDIFYLYSDGLYLKGWEVRGFSTGGSFRTDAKVPAHLIPEFPLPLPEPLAQIHNQAVANLNRNQQHQSPSPTSTATPEFSQSVTQKPQRDSTTDLPAIDDTPLELLISEIVSDFAARISNLPKQEDPTNQAAPTHTPGQPPSSPTSAPSPEISQSVTQKSSTPTPQPNQPLSSPNGAPSLEIWKSVTQKTSNPTRERRGQTSSANTPRCTASPAVHNTPLRHSKFRFVSDFVFRISDFSLPPP